MGDLKWLTAPQTRAPNRADPGINLKWNRFIQVLVGAGGAINLVAKFKFEIWIFLDPGTAGASSDKKSFKYYRHGSVAPEGEHWTRARRRPSGQNDFLSRELLKSCLQNIDLFPIQINTKITIRMVRKAKGRAAVLQTIPVNNEQSMPATNREAEGVLDVMQLISNIESQSR